jgi:hypothetical protein
MNGKWLKSSLSNFSGSCVEVKALPDGGAQVRNSNDPDGGMLTFTEGEWDAFVGGCKNGEFDLDDDGRLIALSEKPKLHTVAE